VQGEKLSAVDKVVDDLLVEMQGAGEITERYRAWLVVNAQPSDIVSFCLGLVFVADGSIFSETIITAHPAWFPT
jgi:hypothetical protein